LSRFLQELELQLARILALRGLQEEDLRGDLDVDMHQLHEPPMTKSVGASLHALPTQADVPALQRSSSSVTPQRNAKPAARPLVRQVSNSVQEQLEGSITQLQHRVQALREVFLVDDARIRSHAIVKIQAAVRGFLYRRRYKVTSGNNSDG
jgi:hypothetical protein